MKTQLLLSLLCIPLLVYGQYDNRMSGKWVETARKGADNKNTSFADTLKIEFLSGNEYLWHKGGSFMYRGAYKIERNYLDLGMTRFGIAELNSNRMVLKGEDGLKYELEPYTIRPRPLPAKRPETYAPVSSLKQAAGKWSVYKRTNDKAPAKVDYTRQIKKVDIYQSPKDGKWGLFYAGMDAADAPSWYVAGYNNQVITLGGKDKRIFRILKAQDNELIMEEDGTIYFLKQF